MAIQYRLYKIGLGVAVEGWVRVLFNKGQTGLCQSVALGTNPVGEALVAVAESACLASVERSGLLQAVLGNSVEESAP